MFHQIWNMETGEIESDTPASDHDDLESYDDGSFRNRFSFLPAAYLGAGATIIVRSTGEGTLSVEPLGIRCMLALPASASRPSAAAPRTRCIRTRPRPTHVNPSMRASAYPSRRQDPRRA